MSTDGMKVQYGSGPSACPGWLNFDCSPSLLVQKIPVLGSWTRRITGVTFDGVVKYGDVRRGLPLRTNSVRFLYCSHVLEHLSLTDFRRALQDSYRVLEPGGVFRGVMPDLEGFIASYLEDGDPGACVRLWEDSYMATVDRPRGISGLMRQVWGNSRHMWLWDYKGTQAELTAAGFSGIRRAHFGDSEFPAFREIEVRDRWERQLGFECTKSG